VFCANTVNGEDASGYIQISNDLTIRRLAILSLMAVFKDIVPGYRIRKLTEKELSEKVSQMVGQTRDWEQGLVAVYQSYLQVLDGEIRSQYLPHARIRVLI
jgi:nucleolar complex protein 3